MDDEAGAPGGGAVDDAPDGGEEPELGGVAGGAGVGAPAGRRRPRWIALAASLVVVLAGAGVVASGAVSPAAVDLPLASGTAQVTWGSQQATAAMSDALPGPVGFSGRLSGRPLTGTLRWSSVLRRLGTGFVRASTGTGPVSTLPDRVRIWDISGRVGTTSFAVHLSVPTTAAERSQFRVLQAEVAAADRARSAAVDRTPSVPPPSDPFALPPSNPFSGSTLGPLGFLSGSASAPRVLDVSGRFGTRTVTGTLTSPGPSVQGRFRLHVGPYAVSGTFADVAGSTNRASATYAVS